MTIRSLVGDLTPLLLSHSRRPIHGKVDWLLLSNGAADLNDNVIFFGFEDNDALPSYVAKVPRLPGNGWIVRTEYERLVELWNRMGVEAADYVPEPLALFQAGQQQVLVISYVRGEGLLYSAKKRLWHDPKRVLALSREAALSLRTLHDRVSFSLDNREKASSDFSRKAEAFIKIYSPSDEELRALSELTGCYMAQTANFRTMIQGDFWHGNIIRDAAHGNLVFVDWQYARWSTDVSLDVYLFLLAGAVAVSQGSSDKERAQSAMNVLRQWRSEIIPAYLAVYGAAERFSLLPARYGMMLCCVEKAVRAVLDFGYNQSDDMIWRNLFTELAMTDRGLFDGI